VAGGNLAGTILLSHVLGSTGQGEFYLAIAIYSLLWFTVNLGLYSITIAKVAAAVAAKSREAATESMAYLARASLFLAILTAALAWTVVPYIANAWLGDQVTDADLVVRAAGILAFSPLLELPRIVTLAGLEGTRSMRAVARVENGQEACRVILVATGALLTGDAMGPVLGMLTASGIGSLLAVDAWRRDLKANELLPRPGEVMRRALRIPLRGGLTLGLQVGFVRNINALGVQILPPLILGRFSSPEWVAYLRIAQKVVDVTRLMMKGISRTALPVLSELAGVKDLVGLRRVYWRASLMSGGTLFTGLLLATPFVRPVLEAMFPRSYVEPVWTCYLILLPGMFFVCFAVANDTFYLVTNQMRIAIYVSTAGMIVNTSVLTYLCWRLPEYGAAWGLSFTFLWAGMHMLYAGLWFRRQARHTPGASAGPISSSP
jgi:O-antigen/teichoic acid export membrane protein